MNIDRFLHWFNSTGVNSEYVKVDYSKETGFGLYSTKRINEKDFVLFSIPEQFFVKPSFEKSDLNGFEHLICYLLENLTNPYVEFLRSIESIPKWIFSLNENYPKQLKIQMNKHLNKYKQSRDKFVQYSNEDFLWAYYTINTRCVYLNMNRDSKDQDDNLCLIPFLGFNSSFYLRKKPNKFVLLDFVNHSNDSNTISKYNPLTSSYEIRTIKSINLNEQITFVYNCHSNIDLFIEYGFILLSNPFNFLNIEYELEQILSKEQIQMLKSFNYWNTLEFYSGDNDISWTILKAIQLNLNEQQWTPYDDPPQQNQQQFIDKFQFLLNLVKTNIENDFQQWITEQFVYEKNILYQDFLRIIDHTSIHIHKSI